MDALIYADMTTGPTGQRVAFEARITEILRALPARPSGAPSDQPLAPHSGRRGRPDRPPARRRCLGRAPTLQRRYRLAPEPARLGWRPVLEVRGDGGLDW
jgi:hypothetical protein